MSSIVINQGSGPVKDANREYARQNIQQFIQDCVDQSIQPPLSTKEPSSFMPPPFPLTHEIQHQEIPDNVLTSQQLRERQEGRYHFVIQYRHQTCLIAMPGCSLSTVRFLDQSGQEAWNYVRVYIGKESSSWLWIFAVSEARSMLFI